MAGSKSVKPFNLENRKNSSVYAKVLETCTMASLHIRLWKNIDSLLRERETEEEYGKAYRAQSREDHDPAFFGRVELPKRWGNGARGP